MMTRFPAIFIFILLFFYALSGAEILPNQVLNYSDFGFITSIAVGFDYVYFGTTNGVIRYKINGDQWADPLTGIDGLVGREIREMKVSQDDQYVWVRTESGSYEYNRTFERWTPIDSIPDEPVTVQHLKADPFFFPPPGYNYLPAGVLVDETGRRFPLTDIVDDGWNYLWVGSWGVGALQAGRNNRRLEFLSYGLLQANIAAMTLDSGSLWMAGPAEADHRTGITIFDWRNNSFNFIETQGGLLFSADNINDLAVGRNAVYVATDDGLLVVDKKERKIKDQLHRRSGLPDNRILSVLAVGDTIFAGTEYGLGLLGVKPDSTLAKTRPMLPSLSILSLEKIDGDLWIGTSQGTYRLDLSTGKLTHLTAPEAAWNRILDIVYDSEKVWLISDEEMVSIDRTTGDIASFPEVRSYGGVRAVALKDSIVAVGTPGGLLLIFDREGSRHVLYTTEDGLISNEIHRLVFDCDYLWVGTDQGLTRFWYANPALGN